MMRFMSGWMWCNHSLVGASLLAMDVNDNVGGLMPRGAATTIASKLAPTGSVAGHDFGGVFRFWGPVPFPDHRPR